MAKQYSDITAADIQQVRKVGSKQFKILEPAHAKSVAQDIVKVFTQPLYQNFIWSDAYGGDHRLFGIENIIPEIATLKSQLDATMTTLYGEQIESTFLCQHVVASQDNQGSGGTFHRDSLRTQYKAFLYLTDVDPDSGALQIVNNSHKLSSKFMEVFKQRKMRVNITQPKIPLNEVTTVSAQAGEVLLCDTSCVHRGSPGLKSDRVNLTLYAYRLGKMPPHIRAKIYAEKSAVA